MKTVLTPYMNATRPKPNMVNQFDGITEQAVPKFAIDFLAYGQTHISNELRKAGVIVTPFGVRSIWLRYDLENFKND